MLAPTAATRPPLPARPLSLAAVLAGVAVLAGCDMLGIEGAGATAARREAEGKAIGAACRHAARSIENCYGSNKKADKAAIFAGWREMNDYMRENKIDAMPAPAAAASAAAPEAEDDAAHAPRAGTKPGRGKGAAKSSA